MNNVQQLIKKDNSGGHSNVTPKTSIDAVDGLKEILQNYNMYFLPYTGSRETTRLQVPMELRKEGLWITYVGYHNNVITEWYNGQSVDDTSFKDSKNWRIGSNALVGDLSISSNGNWVINGDESNFPARGETGVTPILRMEPNTKTIQVTYNEGRLWEDVSERLTTFIPHMAENGDLTWTNSAGLENPARVNLTGPSGVPSDAAHVVQIKGTSNIDVMSQKAVTEELKDVQSQIDVIVVGNTKLTISVSPNIFFEGVSTDVTVKAQLVGAKGKITIGGKVSPNNASELTITDSITNTKRYKATAVVKGQIINSNEVVATATKPYFVGAGNAYTDVYNVEVCKYGPSFSAKGTYQFDVKQNEKIYIIVPNNFSVKSVTFVEGGFGLPVEISSTETLEGYKIYVSAERKEGSYNIKIE